MRIFSKNEFYKKVIGENYKYGIAEKEKKDKISNIDFTINFEENGQKYEFVCNIRRSPKWSLDCQMIKKYSLNIKEKYVAPDLQICLRKEKLNSTYKLYNFIKAYYENY